MTLNQIKQRLRKESDEVSILELLNISMDDILERFEDKIEEKADWLEHELGENTDDNE